MRIPIWYFWGLLVLWILQFVLFRPKQKRALVKTAPAWRWGVALQMLGYAAILHPPVRSWFLPIVLWRIVAGAFFGLVGIGLASNAIRHLGKQWRVKAALIDGHELVTSGPYRIVRHPIYASMVAMNIMCALLLGSLPWWLVGMALFLAGIEIRIHVEDRLLRDRFGARFEAWKTKTPAYL